MAAHAPTRRPAAPATIDGVSALPTLKPLTLALLSAFPVYGVAAPPAITVPAAPPAFAVPRPMPGWRVSGVGAPSPVNQPNANGGTDQIIGQTSQRAIYNWQSFDIGSASSVTFNFPTSDSSALNRVIGSPSPSQIFGALRSQYANPDPTKSPLTGGSIYLINANGVLFGRTAQVNTGALIASTLNLTDADFLSGFANSLASGDPTFTYQGAPALFTDAHDFVRVDNGATITTASGGRVFLFAKNVQNAGVISTPDGQTVLAAGSEVYLNNPTAERLYASEANPAFPALRGLLVEVGQGDGSASNLQGATIDAARGNVTMVGMAVNQLGRVSATTSVSQNGSVLLLARGNATGTLADTGGGYVKHATTSGTLTLGAGSVTEVVPDKATDANGNVPTSDGNSVFTTSRIELAGKTVDLQSGSSVVAHGGIVDVRAEAVPYYQPSTNTSTPDDYSAFDGDDSARLVIDKGATIDVSGTTDTSVSVARQFVTTALLGKSDLKDAPLQKDGPLYRSKVTFDLRDPVPVLGDTSAYQTAIQRTVDERLATGGQVSLTSTGAIVTNAGSTLNVAGGTVNYTAATVVPTTLIAADGTRYTLDQAPKDLVYVGIEGASKPTQDRWGIVPQYVPSQATTGHVEQGYVDGQAGGNLTVAAPHMVLDGVVQAGITTGVRQSGGQDPLPAASSLNLGFRNDGPATLGDAAFVTAGLHDLTITAQAQTLPDDFWAAPLTGAVPVTSRIAASTIDASGVGKVVVTADGGITLQRGADIALSPSSTLDLAAGGAAGITLAADFRSEGGTLAAHTRDLTGVALNGATRAGTITLEAGTTLDVSGAWVNRALDGATVAAATAGGSVTLSSAHALNLQETSAIDVSGGATVTPAGVVQGTKAGSITLEADNKRGSAEQPSAIHLGADLHAQSLVGGGALSVIGADAVSIGSTPIPRGVKDGAAVGSLVLSDQFFRDGAFTRYDIEARSQLQVAAGTALLPQASNWVLTADAAQQASGTKPSSFMQQGQLPDAQRAPVSLSLSAITPFGSTPAGDLSIANGALIQVDPGASVTLAAGLHLDLEGQVVAHGGSVGLALKDVANVGTVEAPVTGLLRVGSTARIDVSGTTVLQPQTGVLPQGTVSAGGSVDIETSALAARTTPVQILSGADIDADGATAQLGVAVTTAAGSTALREQTVSSAGGSVTIVAREGGATVLGNLHAHGGDAQTAAGSFALQLTGVREADPPVNLVPSYTIVVQDAPVVDAPVVAGSVQLSAQSLRNGFADVSLQSRDQIRFNGDVSLSVARNLTLDAPLITASPQSNTVTLNAGGAALLGNSPAADSPTATTAIAGPTQLAIGGGLVEFYGQQGLQGFKAVDATAGSEIRFHGVKNGTTQTGELDLQADLTLSAPQVSVTSNSDYTVNAPGQRLLITGGDAKAAVPLSAGGALTLNASDITTVNPADATQIGVLRAPVGSLTLNATDHIDIGAGSVLSVSGAGTSVFFGTTVGGTNWSYNGNPVSAPAAKTITLSAPGQSVDVATGATLDASGGGTLLATEFVAGPGGSTDVFAGAAGGAYAIVPGVQGYAPQDADTLSQRDARGALPSTQLGRQITFGAGGPLPAGTYTLLPARYALLPNAYLVRPVSAAAPLDLGVDVTKPDGSVLVGGRLGDAGTSTSASLTQTFQLLTSAQAQTFSEIRQSDADTYFAAQATAAGTALPRLPADAGRINLAADQLTLKGTTVFAHSASALGGELDVSADRIRIGNAAADGTTNGGNGTGSTSNTGVLSLDVADLNATGASVLVIGGQRGSTDPNALTATASQVVLDNAGLALGGADVVLVAKDRVELAAGAAIATTGTGTSDPLSLTGDGALLRVSNDPSASSVRTGATRLAGDLVIGAGVSLTGSAITAEATHSTTIAQDATVQAKSLTIGANRIAVGAVDPTQTDPTTLVISPALATQFSGAQSLTLRSFDGIDLVGAATLGGSAVQSLTLDTGTLRLSGNNASDHIEAGGVQLTNTSGADSSITIGSGLLQVVASGAAGGTGQIVIGPGSMAVAGAAQTALQAAHELVLSGQAALAAAGDLTVTASSLQALAGTDATLTAAGRFALAGNGTASTTDGAAGAHVTIGAATIDQGGRIVLPSGALTLTATGDTPASNAGTSNAVHFANGSITDLSGRTGTFDGVAVGTSGGDLHLSAVTGNVAIDSGALLDVSAPAGVSGGSAGSLSIAAVQGGITIGGALRGTSAAGQGGGTLALDSGTEVDLSALAATLAAGTSGASGTSGTGNFNQSIDVRNRIGDQQLLAGTTLAAQHLTLSTDAGTLTIGGALDASGASGTTLTLAAGDTLRIVDGAQLTAHSTGSVGGEVQLMAGKVVLNADGSLQGNGRILLDGGSIDTAAATGTSGVDGDLLLRAQRTADQTDVRIGRTANATGTALTGATKVEIEAVQQYQTATLDTDLIDQVNADNATLAGNNGSNAAAIRNRVGGLFKAPAALPGVQLRAGVEVIQADPTTDLVVAGDPDAGGWNLTRYDNFGRALAQPTGAPINLTLRAAGNLDVQASISDGYTPGGAVAPQTSAAASVIAPNAVVAKVSGIYLDGGRIRLVGGADLGAADVLATKASADQGDVNIGTGDSSVDVLVRTTTGTIQIAAGRDVNLLDRGAAVYTTGKPVDDRPGYGSGALPPSAFLSSAGVTQSSSLSGGGSITVQAARDVNGAPADVDPAQFGSEWLWRSSDPKFGPPTWWARYDQFHQGIATFGGGNVAVIAGRDATNVEASAASSGYQTVDASGTPTGVQRDGGGDLSLAAQRDIVGGFVLGDNGALVVHSGRNIGSDADVAALQVLHGNSQIDIEARNGLDLGLVTSFGLIPGTAEYLRNPITTVLTGLAPTAQLRVVAASGDLNYRGQDPLDAGVALAADHNDAGSGIDHVVPDSTLFAAPGGNVTLGPVAQIPGGDSRLDVLAHGNVTVSTLNVAGTNALQATPSYVSDGSGGSGLATALLDVFAPGTTPLDTGIRTPVRIVAQLGDATVVDGLDITKPLRLLAGRDVVLGADASAFNGLIIQHQADSEISLISAGRDLVFADDGRASGEDLKVYGPGNLVVMAGRNIDLKSSGGIGAVGNRENAALPGASAAVTVLAGVSLGKGDYTQANAWYFPVLGGTGIAGFGPDLAAQLAALQSGASTLPSLGSAAAAAFKAASIDDQVSQVRTLAGAAVFDAAVLADALRRQSDAQPGVPQPAIDQTAANTAFQSLSAADKTTVLDAALANAWAAQVPLAQQHDQVVAMVTAQGPKSTTADALRSFVAAQTGNANLDLGQALAAYQALPPEQQLVLTNQTLVGVIRTAGRTASALTGDARDAAYAQAYAALAVVFPDAAGSGNLEMGSSQLRTLQDSGITVMTPRGGVDVGQLVAGPNPKSASVLGIVTGAGGDIGMVVRDDVNVNQSRVFTVGKGDLLMWSSFGNLDAGRGAKTVTGAPPPLFTLDSNGNFVIDTSGSFSGSGIAVLDASSTLDLYAPKGEINAGDAGIKSLGNAYLGAARFVGADNLSVAGVAVGAPPPASTGGDTAGLAAVGQSATAAGTRIEAGDSDDEKERKRRKRLNLILDFLGFGDGSGKS